MEAIQFWMYNVAVDALQKNYAEAIRNFFKHASKKFPLPQDMTKEQKRDWDEMHNNKYHSVGKAYLALRRFEQMREGVTNEIEEA